MNKQSPGPLISFGSNPNAQIPQGTTLQQLYDELAVRMKRLDSSEDYTSSSLSGDISYLQAASRYGANKEEKDAVNTKLGSLKVAELFKKIWNKHSKEDFTDSNSTTLFSNMIGLLIVMWNGTDKSTSLCGEVYRLGLYGDLLRYLELPHLDPSLTSQYRCQRCVRGITGVLHNMVQRVPDSRMLLREGGAVKILQRYRAASDDMIATKALILQAYVITEADNDQINSDDKTFQYLVGLLSGCMKAEEHYSKSTGFNAHEVFAALNRLAANDSNKARIVKAGTLPLYVQALQPGCSLEEQRLAAEGLWTLAFKCRDDIVNEPGCLDALTRLSETSKDKQVKRQADGVLWIVHGKDKGSRPTSGSRPPSARPSGASAPPPPPDASNKSRRAADNVTSGEHIFISYQWDSKETVLKIRDGLKSAGFKVWVDVDSMSGSVLEAMAEAVEMAEVVIICLSQKYKESPNCRTEAEYTYRLHKTVVPVRLQTRYYPDGWLGALVGSKLVHDFTKDFNFIFPELVRELNKKGRTGGYSNNNDSDPKTVPVQEPGGGRSDIENRNSGSGSSVETWTKQNVVEWLEKNHLSHRNEWFQEFDGSLVHQFRTMRRDAPETFYSLLRENKFNMMEILRISKALDNL